ncbi:unnamed protein product, partial [Mycena citricolor]
ADNVVFAARQIIAPFAQTSECPNWPLWDLGPFLLRYPSLVTSDGRDSQPGSKHHYTRFLCHKLCDNLGRRLDPQPSVDALQLIYGHLLDSFVPLSDFGTHLRVLRTLRTEAVDIRMHRLTAIIQCVMLKTFSPDGSESANLWESEDLSEWEQLSSIFDDEDWLSSVLGLDNDKRTSRASAQQIYGCACAGVWTSFFEQCTARSPDQTERDLDFETVKLVHHALDDIPRVIPTELQRRFADAASAFIRKYPDNCLADHSELHLVLYWAVEENDGYITNVDALHILDSAVSAMQTDDQQESYRDNAEWIRGQMQDRLHPEIILAASVSLVSDGE